jgi:hypothetical protein
MTKKLRAFFAGSAAIMAVVDAGSILMDNIKVFDVRGRLLYAKDNINATRTIFEVGVNQVLIVRLTSARGDTVTRKVIN